MVDLSGVHKVTVGGKVYCYAWRGKGAPRLTAEPGTPEFVAQLASAQEGRKGVNKVLVSGLCAAYRASDDWKELAPKTRTDWSRWLDRIGTEFGAVKISAFDDPRARVNIRRWRDTYKVNPRSADMGLQVLSRLMSFAMAEGMLSTNPVSAVPRLYRNDRSDLIWTEDDLSELSKHASPQVMMAARLAALTSLRKSDLLRLSWSHIGPLAIEIRTGKSNQTKTTLIPIYGELRSLLGTIPKRATTVLTNTEGRPWKSGFGASWNKAVRSAGIDLHFHDLRGTAATRFFLAGLSIREIGEILTWGEDKVERLMNRYVKRDELLLDRIRRLDENELSADAVKIGVKSSSKPPAKGEAK